MTRWNSIPNEMAEALGIEQEKERKYHNKKPTVDGITFDSQKEANYYAKIKMALKNGDIKKIERQVKYRLLDGFDDKEGNHHRPINYFADFRVTWADGTVKIVDTKGYRTQVYKIKKKLLLAKYPDINFIEE
jgi:hypothetical protein